MAEAFLNKPWVQRFLPAVVMAGFVVGSVSFQISSQGEEISELKEDFKEFQKDMGMLQIDQAKDNDFRASGERFSQQDGTQLELRNRDYTDKRIAQSLETIHGKLSELSAGIIRVNDKIDGLVRP